MFRQICQGPIPGPIQGPYFDGFCTMTSTQLNRKLESRWMNVVQTRVAFTLSFKGPYNYCDEPVPISAAARPFQL